eukprot:scaffold120264_cov30-Tisochrysis_lutea.AAC.1
MVPSARIILFIIHHHICTNAWPTIARSLSPAKGQGGESFTIYEVDGCSLLRSVSRGVRFVNLSSALSRGAAARNKFQGSCFYCCIAYPELSYAELSLSHFTFYLLRRQQGGGGGWARVVDLFWSQYLK